MKQPRSPVTEVNRSLSGLSQLTRWLTIVPSDSWPTAETMSSCGRPDLETVCAAIEVYAWPVTQPVRSMSWVARSPDHADVGDPVREGALAAGDDLVDVAQLAGLQAGAEREQGGVAAFDVADAGDQAAPLEGVDEAAGALDGVGERLLDEGADAGVGELEADLLVQRGRAGHDGVVDAERDELFDGGQDGSALGPAVLVAHGVHDADQFDALQAREDAGVVAAHGAEADEPGLECGGHRFSPRAFTAVTMRSRSPWVSEGWTGSETTSAAAFSVSGRSQVRPAFWSGSQ